MARKRSTAPTAPTAAPKPEPRTEAEFLAAIPAKPRTEKEFAAAYDGHTARCISTRECSCNPFAEHPRVVAVEECVPWRHWRDDLAHRRWLAA